MLLVIKRCHKSPCRCHKVMCQILLTNNGFIISKGLHKFEEGKCRICNYHRMRVKNCVSQNTVQNLSALQNKTTFQFSSLVYVKFLHFLGTLDRLLTRQKNVVLLSVFASFLLACLVLYFIRMRS